MAFYGEQAKERWKQAAARKVLAAAVYFETQHRLRLNVSNPRPYLNSSQPGEYPRARTGWGRDHVTHQPATVEAVIAAGLRVRVGYEQSAWYMLDLELNRRRLGLLKTLSDTRAQLRAHVAGTGRKP